MVKKITLNAELRKDQNINSKAIRREGFVPAVVYGKNQENINIKIKELDVERAYASAGESSLVDLKLQSKDPLKVIIKDIQTDVVKGNIIHADFYIIDVNVPIEVEVPLIFINESKAVKELNGILSKNKETILVKCLPDNLISELEVDISVLNTFNDSVKVRDVKVPENLTVLDSLDDLIINAIEPRQQEEEEEIKETSEEKEGEEDKKEGEEEKTADKQETKDKK